ncbi:MAG: ferredoxin [Denitromonas halophila]|nr:MAG: ferredoxin [Denitromonas halophila]TVT75299.1 MAG: ferredoxin [Denitromonas halophila]
MTKLINPFHAGELEAQARAGVGDVAGWAAGFVRDHLPEQHRAFHGALPFLVLAAAGEDGRVWTTLVEGGDGFVRSPDPRHIALHTTLNAADPLAVACHAGTEVGVLGIDLATRRRNRFSGYLRPDGAGYVIDVRQTFGNCPQYINERVWTRLEPDSPHAASMTDGLTQRQRALIGAADTLFIGSGHVRPEGAASNGYDASHRGGAPGFVQVVDGAHLRIPDYAGNNFFNTIGNLVADPRVGLLFVDFEAGSLLHVTGRATIDWYPQDGHDPEARRMINVTIDAVLERPGAMSLRWFRRGASSRRLRLVRREAESARITSFYFASEDGRALDRFQAGQHLPVSVAVPGRPGVAERTYSLSGSPADPMQYRLSVKRETQGLVSRFLHDTLREGEVIEARAPAGDFVIPCDHCPLVLVSAGVGLTPMVSMLHATAGQGRTVWFVHGVRNGREHALRAEVDRLLAEGGGVRRGIFFYSHPDPNDLIGRDYDVRGRVSAAGLLALDAGVSARYLLCGPPPFLADIQRGLEAGGVAPERIHVETFGPRG